MRGANKPFVFCRAAGFTKTVSRKGETRKAQTPEPGAPRATPNPRARRCPFGLPLSAAPMTLPTITPIQALTRLRSEGDFELEGWTFTLDGPPFCPPEMMYPRADQGDATACPTGEPWDPITEADTWVET